MEFRVVNFKDASGKIQQGTFHRWGSQLVTKKNGDEIEVTKGIIESRKGEINMVDPENITFMDIPTYEPLIEYK